MIVWWLVKSLWNSPYTISRYFRVRRRDRGYQALSTGMIAAGAGDGALARKKNKEAAKLIRSDQEPLIRCSTRRRRCWKATMGAARKVRDHARRSRKCGCWACAGSISRPNGWATAMPPGTMPAAPP